MPHEEHARLSASDDAPLSASMFDGEPMPDLPTHMSFSHALIVHLAPPSQCSSVFCQPAKPKAASSLSMAAVRSM